MNLVKRIVALCLVAVMALCVVGCHEKNEVALTVGEVEFTSAYYMCALIHADGDARGLIDEKLAEKNEKEGQTEEVDYFKQKIDKMSFEEYVIKTAKDNLKRIAAYKTKCDESKLKLEQSVVDGSKQMVEYYWNNYGYQQIFEPNGVSKATYTAYALDEYYSSLYFGHLYGEKGDREISAEDVKKALNDEFAVANILSTNYDAETTDEQKNAAKTQFDGFANAIKNGTKTFEQVNKEYTGATDEQATEQTEENKEEAEPGTTPQDSNAQILGTEDSGYGSEYYDTVKKMAVGEVKVINAESGNLVLLVKKDINTDPYYLKTLDMTCRKLLKGDELDEEIVKYAKKLSFDESKFATKQFKVKKIEYPEAQQ